MELISCLIFITIVSSQHIQAQLINPKLDHREIKCLVCQTTLDEIDQAIDQIDPKRTVDIGGYQLDSKGNMKQKTVPQAQSEVHLSEIMETICEKLDDYVRAKYKSNGKLMLLRLMDKNGGMNPEMSEVDIVQDDDLNKSLKYYCEGILSDWEDNIISHYVKKSDNIDIRVCSLEAKVCNHTLPSNDDDFHFSDEL